MKLDNQKNGWKGVCVYQETNGEEYFCPVRALARHFIHIRQHGGSAKSFLSSYWTNGIRADVKAEDISRALKAAATELQYPTTKGIPIARINTHSLRSGGANALALAGYSDTQIQKMGRWRGATFKEYIREELACYARNMSRDMKCKFNFVNIAGNAFSSTAPCFPLLAGLVVVVKQAPTPHPLTNGRLFESGGSLGRAGLTQASYRHHTQNSPYTPSTDSRQCAY